MHFQSVDPNDSFVKCSDACYDADRKEEVERWLESGCGYEDGANLDKGPCMDIRISERADNTAALAAR